MLITWKLPKSIAGRTKRPRGPRVWYPDLTQRNKKKQDHASASRLNRPITACWYSCRYGWLNA